MPWVAVNAPLKTDRSTNPNWVAMSVRDRGVLRGATIAWRQASSRCSRIVAAAVASKPMLVLPRVWPWHFLLVNSRVGVWIRDLSGTRGALPRAVAHCAGRVR